MKKNMLISGIFIIIIVSVFSGCQEQKAVAITHSKNIEFNSDLVQLVHSDMKKRTDQGKVLGIDVEYLFKNIAGRSLNLSISVEFYTKYDELLFTGGPKSIDLLEGWTEQGVSPYVNVISYSGRRADEVDHVKIVVTEI